MVNVLLDYPAADGRTVQQLHANICAKRGHAYWIVNGVEHGVCPRCGVVKVCLVKSAR